MATPGREHSTGDEARAPHAGPSLQRAECVALAVLRDHCGIPAGPVSGHCMRRELQRRGLAKLDATLALRALVGHGLVARVRCDEPDGQFYTAYRLTARGVAWLRANGDAEASPASA